MNKSQRLVDYIQHLEKYSKEALLFIEGMSEEEFDKDIKTQRATTLNLITLGEISTLLSKNYPDFVEATRDTPWRNISGMRNRLVHGYNEIDKKAVWNTLKRDLPVFVEQIPSFFRLEQSLQKNQEPPEAELEM